MAQAFGFIQHEYRWTFEEMMKLTPTRILFLETWLKWHKDHLEQQQQKARIENEHKSASD